tara:strand:+ start:499 stop:1239 length:741 start_codon:yes stop_codon:yes gene_type:complete
MSIQLVKPKDYTPTESVLHDMFTENTGMSMGDSGGDDNRHWQRNQEVVDFRDREPFTYSYDGKYFDISKDLFHHLCDALEYDQLATIKWERWVNETDEMRYNTMSGVEEYLENDGIAHEITSSGNSANDETLLNQVFQYVIDRETSQVYIAIHGGCDVRGGYTDFKAFEYEDDTLFDWCRASLSCGCGDLREMTDGSVFTDDLGNHWYDDWTGYTWNNGLPCIWQKHLFRNKLVCKICKQDVEVGT